MDFKCDPTQIPLPPSLPYQQSNDPSPIFNLENNHAISMISPNWIQSDSQTSSSHSPLASCLSAHSHDAQSIHPNPNVNTLHQLDLDSNTLNPPRNSPLASSSSTHSPDPSIMTLSFQSNDSFAATLPARSLTESNTHTIPDHDSHFNLPSETSIVSCPTFGHRSINDIQPISSIDESDDAGIDELYMLTLDGIGIFGIDSHQSEPTPIASHLTLNGSNRQSLHPNTDVADPTQSSAAFIDPSPTSNLVDPLRINKNIPATDINPLSLNPNRSSNTATLLKLFISDFPAPVTDSHAFINRGDSPHQLVTNAVVSIDPTNVPLPPSPPILPPSELPLVIEMISDDALDQPDPVHQTDLSTLLTSSEHNILTTNLVYNTDSLVHEHTVTKIHGLIQPPTFPQTYASPQSEPHISQFDSDSDSGSDSESDSGCFQSPEFEFGSGPSPTKPKFPTLSHCSKSTNFSLAQSSRMAAQLDRVITVPSNGQPVNVVPITHIAVVPLYRCQPALSPILSIIPGNDDDDTDDTDADEKTLILSKPISDPPLDRPPPVRQSIGSNRLRLRHTVRDLEFNVPSLPTPTIITKPIPSTRRLTDSLPGLRRPRLRPPKVPEPRLNDLMNEKPVHSDHYCCFAIPLYNTGIYVILAQFTVFGFVAGVLAFAAPSVIAIAVHEALTAVMGVLCILIGCFQLMGFYGVYKERVKIFRIYLYINSAFVLITLGYSLIIMILSAQQHSTAIEQCLLQFVSADGDTTETPSNESRTLCNIWTWAQLGICGLLWILFGTSETYFCFLQRRWSQDQKMDHLKYRSIISAVRESLAVRNSEEIERRSESNDEGVPRGMNGVVKGGSRLKNEIEWKPISTGPQEEQEITELKSHDSGSGSSDAEFYRKSSAHVNDQHRQRGDSTLSAPKSILKNSTSRSNSSSTVV